MLVQSCILQTERLRPCEEVCGGLILSLLASFFQQILIDNLLSVKYRDAAGVGEVNKARLPQGTAA